MGPSGLPWSEIAAFVALTGTRLMAWEIELIELIDRTWLMVAGDDQWQPKLDDGED